MTASRTDEPVVRKARRRGLGRAAAVLALAGTLAAAVGSGATSGASPAIPARSGTAAGPAAVTQSMARVNGTGSTYVGLAMQQWTAEAQVQGLQVNYTPTGSPDGLSRYRGGQVDFAGTEAEFASLQVGGDVSRGFHYVPDVAGAVAIMYNVDDVAGRPVDYLHLSRSTVAKIFMGEITSWSDPQIAADNRPANLRLPDQPINVVYRSGQSGTTALFYDFVREMEPGIFGQWAGRNGFPTNVRIIQLDSSPGFAPRTQALAGSDQMAQFTASDAGKWSIAYDEFGYAKVYGAPVAWIDNAAGQWVQPYAENISAALDSATLRPDLSQELAGVYRSTNPLAYPISAYSYVVTQCQTAGDRPTCRGPYSNEGVTNTLTAWLRYIACDGQIRMAQIGYSPLPPNLSQEIANSIARMNGTAPERLDASNCANPRFRGSLGAGASSPPDPYLGLAGGGGGGGGGAGGGGGGSAGTGDGGGPTGGGSGGPTGAGGPAANAAGGPAAAAGGAASTPGATAGGPATPADAAAGATEGGVDPGAEVAAGRIGASVAVGGGSATWRAAAPASYPVAATGTSAWPVVLLVAAFALPALVPSASRRWRRRRPTVSG